MNTWEIGKIIERSICYRSRIRKWWKKCCPNLSINYMMKGCLTHQLCLFISNR